MSDRVRAVQERRRSNAAGPHGRRPTRAEELSAALAEYEEETRTDDAQEATT